MIWTSEGSAHDVFFTGSLSAGNRIGSMLVRGLASRWLFPIWETRENAKFTRTHVDIDRKIGAVPISLVKFRHMHTDI